MYILEIACEKKLFIFNISHGGGRGYISFEYETSINTSISDEMIMHFGNRTKKIAYFINF